MTTNKSIRIKDLYIHLYKTNTKKQKRVNLIHSTKEKRVNKLMAQRLLLDFDTSTRTTQLNRNEIKE